MAVTQKTPQRRTLSARWKKTAGILRNRKGQLGGHVKRVRAEWVGR